MRISSLPKPVCKAQIRIIRAMDRNKGERRQVAATALVADLTQSRTVLPTLHYVFAASLFLLTRTPYLKARQTGGSSHLFYRPPFPENP